MKKKKTANRRKHPWPEDKPAKSLSVHVCCVCGRMVNANDVYCHDPRTGRLSGDHAWCRDCYERAITRSCKQPTSMQKLA